METWTKDPVDIFIGIDAPDFNLRLSKPLNKNSYRLKPCNTSVLLSGHGVKVVCMALKPVLIWYCAYFHLKSLFKQWDVPAAFVGHPLASQLPLENPILAAKTELGLDPHQKYIALLPGSRRGG